MFQNVKRVGMSEITTKNVSTNRKQTLKRNWENLKKHS